MGTVRIAFAFTPGKKMKTFTRILILGILMMLWLTAVWVGQPVPQKMVEWLEWKTLGLDVPQTVPKGRNGEDFPQTELLSRHGIMMIWTITRHKRMETIS